MLRTPALRVALTLTLVAAPAQRAMAQTTEVIIDWNRVLNEAIATPGALPSTIVFPRPYAILHVAIFDALNSIDNLYMPYHVRVNAAPGASPEAAVAQAAHDVLVAMLPTQQAAFDTALATTLAPLAPGAAADGAAVGRAVAREILELRRNDGWSRAQTPYLLPRLPGYWQPTPPNNPVAAFTQYPDVVAFGLDGPNISGPRHLRR